MFVVKPPFALRVALPTCVPSRISATLPAPVNTVRVLLYALQVERIAVLHRELIEGVRRQTRELVARRAPIAARHVHRLPGLAHHGPLDVRLRDVREGVAPAEAHARPCGHREVLTRDRVGRAGGHLRRRRADRRRQELRHAGAEERQLRRRFDRVREPEAERAVREERAELREAVARRRGARRLHAAERRAERARRAGVEAVDQSPRPTGTRSSADR